MAGKICTWRRSWRRCGTGGALFVANALLFGVVSEAADPTSAVATFQRAVATFEEVRWETYRHAAPNFSLRYPYQYRRGAQGLGPGEVLAVADPGLLPSINVALAPRSMDLPLEASAAAAAKRISPLAKVVSERTIDLGGVPARAAVVEWSAPFGLGVALRTLLVSAYHDNDWVIVTASDGVTSGPMLPDLETAAMSLRFE